VDIQPRPAPSLLDVAGAAEYLGTSVRFVRRLVAERRIAFHHVGRLVRIDSADLQAYLDANRVEPIRAGLLYRREVA
jgi:excisionase family DNA binding protein